MASQSVQFWGKDAVLNAYDSRDADTWAIFTGKELITKGTGREDLSTFLSMLSDGFSNAIYILKIYDQESEADVKDNTPCDGSFRFSLSSTGGAVSGSGGNDALNARLAAIEKKLSGPQEETETIGSVLLGLLKEPEQLVHLITAGRMLLGFNTPQMAAGVTAPPRQLAGITDDILEGPDDNKRERLVRCLDILGEGDPKFIDRLEKLAKIKTESPDSYKALIAMLELK